MRIRAEKGDSKYHHSMPPSPLSPRPLMGEFNRTNGPGKRFSVTLYDIFTIKNFSIAIIAASMGYVIFEHMRKQL
jgi:hypothetical protein